MKKPHLIASLTTIVFTGSAFAGVVVPSGFSTTDYQSTDGDWLSNTTDDIDGNGLGTDGFLFFGNFNGVQQNGQPFTHRVTSTPSYVSGFAAGAQFSSVADEFSNVGPGYGFIDDPNLLDGTDTRSGGAVGVVGGAAGSTGEILTFTVSGLTGTVRVGILSGNLQASDGRWDPTSITLSDGSNSATVGDHSTAQLPIVPGGVNVGWVFFDIDADGTYSVQATKRLSSQGISIGGLTFDSVVPEPGSLALMGIGGFIMLRRRRK